MGSYRGVVRHVRYWRGSIQRWSTVYPMQGTISGGTAAGLAASLLAADDAMCFTSTNAYGGTYQCDIYNQASGGVPIASDVRFPWDTPASWIGYAGGAWGGLTGSFEANAEVALQVEWPGGLSVSGKPVTFKKWYHAVLAENPSGGAAQVPAAAVTSLQAGAVAIQSAIAAKGLVLQSVSGRIAGTPRVLTFYGNHQMPKGRKRKALVGSSKSSSSELSSLIEAAVAAAVAGGGE